MTDEEWNLFIIQSSSIRLFECGVKLACLIILANWFPLKISGLVVALWDSSYLWIPTIEQFFDLDPSLYYVRIFPLQPPILIPLVVY